MLNITRNNFREMRKANHITLNDISKECGLHVNTIRLYEKGIGRYTDVNARDYNKKLMNNKLKELIERRSEIGTVGQGYITDILKVDFYNDISDYLTSISSKIDEFTIMCGINKNAIYPSTNKKQPFVSRYILEKVMQATGWSYDDIKNHKLIKKEEDKKMGYVPSTKSIADTTTPEEVKTAMDMFTKAEVNKDVLNVKYTFENGEFFREYDILKHVKQPITKEMFMKEVSKND